MTLDLAFRAGELSVENSRLKKEIAHLREAIVITAKALCDAGTHLRDGDMEAASVALVECESALKRMVP